MATTYYYFGLGDLLREKNELEAAERHLVYGVGLVNEEMPLAPWYVIQGYNALAHLQQSRGNASTARVTLDTLAHLLLQRHVAASALAQEAAGRAHLDLLQGNLAAAMHWAETSGLSPNDTDLPYLREHEYLTLARVRIAQARSTPGVLSLQEVLYLLERLLQEAESKARLGSVLQILIVRTLALEVQGDRKGALATLEQALVLAEPEGYIRLFVDEGLPMQALLYLAQARGILPGYVATLLNAWGEQQLPHAPPSSASPSLLVEPLTEREREVLRLLIEGASNQKIAQELVIVIATVKRHITHIFSKLGVQNRVQAIRQAQKLGLLSSELEIPAETPLPRHTPPAGL